MKLVNAPPTLLPAAEMCFLSAVVSKCSPQEQQQNHIQTCWKCEFWGPHPNLPCQQIGLRHGACVLRSPPSDSDEHSRWRVPSPGLPLPRAALPLALLQGPQRMKGVPWLDTRQVSLS